VAKVERAGPAFVRVNRAYETIAVLARSNSEDFGARRVFRDGSYSAVQGLWRPEIRSVRRIPAIVPCVRPIPESPAAMYTLSSSPGFRPISARPSTVFIVWPDQ
jgi:hypothetical protein